MSKLITLQEKIDKKAEEKAAKDWAEAKQICCEVLTPFFKGHKDSEQARKALSRLFQATSWGVTSYERTSDLVEVPQCYIDHVREEMSEHLLKQIVDLSSQCDELRELIDESRNA